jgi:hypothetical protein
MVAGSGAGAPPPAFALLLPPHSNRFFKFQFVRSLEVRLLCLQQLLCLKKQTKRVVFSANYLCHLCHVTPGCWL